LRGAWAQLRQSLLDLRTIRRVRTIAEVALERSDGVTKITDLLVAIGDRDEDHRRVSQLVRALEAMQCLDVRASFEQTTTVIVRAASLDHARIFRRRCLWRTRAALRLRALRTEGERPERKKENGDATHRVRAFHGS
jgi:hypothetical protein